MLRHQALPVLLILAASACGGGASIEEPLLTSSMEARGGKNRCGDGQCRSRESCSTCPADCGMCPAPPADAGFVDSGVSEPDSGVSEADAGVSEPDSGASSPDSGTTLADSGASKGPIDCRAAETWPSGWVNYEDEVLRLVNARRAEGATCGTTVYPAAPPLAMDSALREAARCHSLDMGEQGYFSHTSQDGRSPWTRIDQAGYTGSATAENIAAGYGTPSAVVTGWMGSSGHCSNIMSARSNEIGVGYAYVSRSPYGHYWTQDFGVR